jgi:hypothetical protein
MNHYCPACDWQIEIARRMVAKDRRQRWVYQDREGHYHISETPIPYQDAVSVYWMPIVGCIGYTFRYAKLAHSAIGAI